MKRQTKKMWRKLSFLLWLIPAIAFAREEAITPHIKTMDKLLASHERDEALERLASEFSDFFGSKQSAETVLAGLRDSKPISLAQTATEASLLIRPPTKPMSLANAYLAMSMVKMHLAVFGISRPTPTQVKLALNGGGFTQVFSGAARNIRMKGVLTLRAKGQSWESIAKALGVNVNILSYGMQASNSLLKHHASVITNVKPSPFFADSPPEEEVIGSPISLRSQFADHAGRARKFGAGIVTAGGGAPASINTIHGENSEGIVTANGVFIPSSSRKENQVNAGGL